ELDGRRFVAKPFSPLKIETGGYTPQISIPQIHPRITSVEGKGKLGRKSIRKITGRNGTRGALVYRDFPSHRSGDRRMVAKRIDARGNGVAIHMTMLAC